MNWMRENEPPRTEAVVLIASVLARPGDALDQQVAARKQADEESLEHALLAGDHSPNLEEGFLESRARLAADRGATVSVLTAIEVPSELPLHAQMPDEEQALVKSLRRPARSVSSTAST